MKAVVLVKHVPDVQSARQMDGGRLVRGDDDAINELDENALEAAIAAVEDHGGEVIAVTMGPEDAVDAVRRGLQMGADAAIHVCDDALAGADIPTTASVLAKVVEHVGDVDVVFAGMAASDGEAALVPAVVAAKLGWPVLTVASQLECDGASVKITRTSERVTEVLEADFPVVVSVTDQVNEARIPAFRQMMAARKKQVETLSAADLGISVQTRANVRSAEAVPAREKGEIIANTGDGGERLAAYLKGLI